MFDVLAPGKLVLTLRSTPPFVAETAFALALTILLAAPLIVRVHRLLLDKQLRALTKTASSSHRRRHGRSLLIHFPAPIAVADSTSSSSLFRSESARRVNSTPILRSNGGAPGSLNRRETRVDGESGDRGSRIRKCPPLGPSSFADPPRPIVDISSLDYKAHRHRLIEATLKKQYDDLQPPGDVVLNSLHLNSADSVIGVRLSNRYDHSLFDFVEEYYDVAASRRNVERLHPLDHFLSRGARRPRTSEKETETVPESGVDPDNGGNHLPANVDGDPAKLPRVDDNGNPCVRASPPDDVLATWDPRSEAAISRGSIPPRSRRRAGKTTPGRNAEDDCPRSAERSSSSRNDRPASREATARPGTAAGRSRGSKKKLEDYPCAASPLSGERRADGEAGGTLNFISVSSSEIASIRSDSSKRRDDQVSCRSRESSISPSSRTSSRPPWLSGSRGTSFNRKYGRNITEISAARTARPMSARGRLAARGRSKESSAGTLGRRAASFVAPRGEEFTGMTSEGPGEENLAARPRGQRSESKDVGSAAAEANEEGRALRTADLPRGGKLPARGATLPDDAATFLPSPNARRKARSPRAASSADAPVTASKTLATKKPELTTSRRGADGARGCLVPGNNAPRLSPARDRRGCSAKLNRGGRRQLRSAENPSKGASLSPQIELSDRMLNPADDTDKSAIPDGEGPAGLASRIDPRVEAASGGIRAESARAASGVKSNSAGDVARSRAPKMMRDPRARLGANGLAEGCGPDGAASHPARLDANSATESGLNGTKLNTRSNGAVDEMRYDGSPSAKSSSLAARECGNVATEPGETRQGLQLPRRDSKIGLAMNSALRRYIKMLKQGLLNHGDRHGVALASLSLSDAVSILSERRTPLSPEEVQELQLVLDKIERNPELLCKLSCPSMESVA